MKTKILVDFQTCISIPLMIFSFVTRQNVRVQFLRGFVLSPELICFCFFGKHSKEKAGALLFFYPINFIEWKGTRTSSRTLRISIFIIHTVWALKLFFIFVNTYFYHEIIWNKFKMKKTILQKVTCLSLHLYFATVKYRKVITVKYIK